MVKVHKEKPNPKSLKKTICKYNLLECVLLSESLCELALVIKRTFFI